MNIFIKSTSGWVTFTNSELSEGCVIGKIIDRKLLPGQEITPDGEVVTISGLSYLIGKREYPLGDLFGIKAIATKDGIIPILRKAKGKEKTITQKISKDRFGQIQITGKQNEYWPVVVNCIENVEITDNVQILEESEEEDEESGIEDC